MESLVVRIRRAGYKGGFMLRNISFSLDEGEALLVTGPSGSGKTTLLKTIIGIIGRGEGVLDGEILFYGKKQGSYDPRGLFRLLCYIPQEPWYGILSYTVLTDYCLSLSQAGVKCDPSSLKRYGLWEIRDSVTYGLSAGQYQRLSWASSMDRLCRIALIDEPLVYIDMNDRDRFAGLVREGLSNNMSIIIVDHDPTMWRDIASKMLVLKGGYQSYYGPFHWETHRGAILPQRGTHTSGGEVLVARNVWFKYPGGPMILKNISLTLRGGVISGVTGRNGAGKTTLLKVLAGTYKPYKGSVYRRVNPIYLPEEPLIYFSHPTPREEIYVGGDKAVADELVGEFGLEKLLDRPIAYLSTGERRRIALASALSHHYGLLLLDEPSGGLDDDNVSVLIGMIYRAAERGVAVLIATHDPRLTRVLEEKYLLERGVLKRA